MSVEKRTSDEVQSDKAENHFEQALKLVVNGKEAKYWGPCTFKDDPKVEVTREECEKFAGGKPWVLVNVDTYNHRSSGDSPAMWNGMTKEDTWVFCPGSASYEDAKEREQQEG